MELLLKSYLFNADLVFIVPEVFILLAVLLVLVFGVMSFGTSVYQAPLVAKSIHSINVLVLFMGCVLICVGQHVAPLALFNAAYLVDELAQVCKFVVCTACFCVLVCSIKYYAHSRINNFEYSLLLVFATLSLMVLASGHDLLILYLGVEFQSLIFYVIAAFNRTNELSVEAGIKYFVLGAFASGLLLFGQSLLYGFTGVIHFDEMAKLMHFENICVSSVAWPAKVGFLFVFVSFLFKIGAAPFHTWVADVYTGAPLSTTAFFASVPKISLFVAFLRFFTFSGLELATFWHSFAIICGLFSILVGCFGALRQTKLKRVLAFSSIAHVGNLLLAFSIGQQESAEALIFYLILYTIISLSLFACLLGLVEVRKSVGYNFKLPWLMSIRTRSPLSHANPTVKLGRLHSHNLLWSASKWGWSNSKFKSKQRCYTVQHITDLCTLGQSHVSLATAIALLFFSNAGVPPLAGFFSKLYVIFAVLQAKMVLVSILLVIGSVIGAFYSIRLIKVLFFHAVNSPKWHFIGPLPKANAFVLSLGLTFNLGFWLEPSLVYAYTHLAVLEFYI